MTASTETTETTNMTEPKRFLVTWTEISHHERELTLEELEACQRAGGGDPDVGETDGLADGLAVLDDDGFQYLTREDIDVTPIQ